MKTFNLLILITLFAKISFAQIAINTNGASSHGSAILDVSSTSKGILIPRMNTSQRTGIGSPAKGLMVFDNDTNSYWFYNGSAWSNLSTTPLTLPYQQTINSGVDAFEITNNGVGAALKGNSTVVNGAGVYGETSNGTGVKGYSSNAGSVAVFGSSASGTGLKGYSFTGTALDINGNVKIAGGNTNPSDGAVLTSDASGNATWQKNNPPKISFAVRGVANGTIPYISIAKIEYLNEDHDLQNNFAHFTGVASSTSSKFTAPIPGVYSFSASMELEYNYPLYNINSAHISIFKNGTAYTTRSGSPNNSNTSVVQLMIETTMHLNANDIISIGVNQFNGGGDPVNCDNSVESSHFSGHLLFAD